MSAPKYVTEEEYFRRMTDFTGYIGHMNNQTKSELRKEIIFSEECIKTELRAEIAASDERVKIELPTEIAVVEAQVTQKTDTFADTMAAIKADLREIMSLTLEDHKMLQLVLDQLSAMRSERRRD